MNLLLFSAVDLYSQIPPIPEISPNGLIDGVAPVQDDSKLTNLLVSRNYIYSLQSEKASSRRELDGMENLLRELGGDQVVNAWREVSHLYVRKGGSALWTRLIRFPLCTLPSAWPSLSSL